MATQQTVAYFSMEMALETLMPTYSGGLGVLAGDTIRAAAELKVPMVAVTLLHRKGYFYQRLDPSGWQREEPAAWAIEEFLKETPARATVEVEGRKVQVRAWRYDVTAPDGFVVPVLLLDTDLPENTDFDRTLTHHLYGGDAHYRLCQELILGVGGVRMLRTLGYGNIARFHLNEGHAALLTLALLDEQAARENRSTFVHADIEKVRQLCAFTTHTPVAAGHDKFPFDLVMRVLGRSELAAMKEVFCCDNALNLTFLALNLSHYVNGVARKHAEVSRLMFGNHQVDSITNGVHAGTWTSPPLVSLFDRYIPGWREDNASLRNAMAIPLADIWAAHAEAKRSLVDYVNRETNAGLQVDVLTLGFARRATAYKRADLLFRDVERLRAIAAKAGSFQLVFGGKAHPRDQEGKELIKRIFHMRDVLGQDIKVVYLENYDTAVAKLMTSGVDVWLNTPQPPMEASGTSGMKAALNGVPSLSVLDGWWLEGCVEGVTGWAIGERCELSHNNPADRAACDAASLYDKLEHIIVPLYYQQRDRFSDVMRHAIALNGSFFNTQRMVMQYVVKAYFR